MTLGIIKKELRCFEGIIQSEFKREQSKKITAYRTHAK
jgi:hypothetical protein